MANWQVISLDTATPQLRAPGTGDGYSFDSGATNLGTWTTSLLTVSTALTASGAVTATKLVPTGNVTAGNGMYLPTTNTLAFSTDGSERVRVTSVGEVGIGTTSPNIGSLTGTVLTINGSVQSNLEMASAGASRARIASSSTDTTFETRVSAPLVFGTNSTERMRLDASGNLGIGTTAPVVRTQIVNNGGVGSSVSVFRTQSEGAYLDVEITPQANPTEAVIRLTSFSGGGGNSSNSALAFNTRTSGTNSEKMRINSAGEVLVGGTTSLIGRTSVSIQHTNNDPILTFFRNDTTITLGNQLGRIVFYGNDTTSNTPTFHAAIDAVASGDHAAGDNPTDIVFTTTPDGTATAAEAGRITQSGSYVLKGGTTTAAAGVGVIFPATQVASADANSLDDYEEGTWTPVYVASTSGTATYTTQTGWYTKVGNLVTAGGRLTCAKNTLSGNISVGGLPFTSNANYRGSVCVAPTRRWATEFTMLGYLSTSGTEFNIAKNDTNEIDPVPITDADMMSNTNYNDLYFSVSYYV